ncbi:MAG: signal transduction histidine kinase [Candidatus Aldehydirespiratoraceae bacterium]
MIVDPGEQERLDRLRQFVVLDVVVSSLATAFTLAVYLWVESNVWLLVAGAMAGSAAITMAMGLRPLKQGRAVAACWWLVAGNWGVALTTAAVATFAWPVQIMAAVLPVIISAPYVSRRQFRVMIIGAVIVGTSAAALGLLQDFSGLTESVPEWVTDAVLIIFAPFMAVLITQAGAQTAASLRDSLRLSVEANEGLQVSQAQIASQAELLRLSRSRIVAAADHERRRIERDLHDGAQQRLVGLSLQISLTKELVSSDPAAARDTLDRIRDEVRHAQEEMRALVRGLYPPVLTQHGLGPALRAMVGQLENPLRADINDVPRMDPGREAAVYFLCLEAVQNVLKHAGSNAVISVSLCEEADDMILIVEDNGTGFDLTVDRTGAGIQNMEDRMGAAAGSIDIQSTPGIGTSVAARIPLR